MLNSSFICSMMVAYIMYYIVAFEKLERLKLIEKGDLEPEIKVKIGTYNFSELIVFKQDYH